MHAGFESNNVQSPVGTFSSQYAMEIDCNDLELAVVLEVWIGTV